MKYIPKYITTDILAEYGEHLTHEAYNEMVKLNITQGDYNTTVLNQLFNTDEGIQIPYLDNKIKKVTDDQAIINEDMDNIVADMIALKGSLSKYTTFTDVRRIVTESTQGFVKTNKIKAGENVEVVVDANNNVIISATGGGGGGDVTKAYVDEQDAATLQSSKGYTDTKISQIPIPVVPTNISAFNNDVGYITGYTETDPVFSASAAAGITSQDITDWNSKSDFSGDYNDLQNKPDLSNYVTKNTTQAISGSKLFTTIPQTNQQATENNHIINKKYFDDNVPTVPTNISAFNNDSGYITGYTETDPVFSASAAAGITAQDITNWNSLSNLVDGSASGSLRGVNTEEEVDDQSDPDYYVMGSNAIAIGNSTKATGNSAIAAGPGGAVASGTGAVAIGYGANASGSGAFALGSSATASGNESFALGTGATASGSSSLALGSGATANGTGGTMVVGSSSSTSSSSFSSVVLGLSSSVTGSSQGCAAIGYQATATGFGTTAFNQGNASGNFTHAEGSGTASNSYSHAEGQSTVANGANAHAEGMYTEAGNMQHAEGFYNLVENLPVIHMVGNGSSGARSNAYTLDQLGNGWYAQDVYVGSTSGTHKDAGSVKLLRETVITPVYSSSSTYNVGDQVMYDGALYTCNTAITTAEDWTAAHWTQHTIADSLEEAWFFDPNKQGALGTTDSLHFLNCNRYQQPFVFDGKQKGMYVFAPMGFNNGSQLEQCFKGTSAATTYFGIAGCCFLVIVKDYATAATEEDIAFGWGFGVNGPMTFGFKKDTTAASGLKRTNMDYYNSNIYTSSQATETIAGTKTFSTIPRVSTTANPTNIQQLVSYNAFMGLLTGGDYSTSNTYNKGQYTRYNNRMWQCNADNVTGAWDSTKWTDLYGTSILGSVIDYVDNKYVPTYETYSATETRIGTWTDGKPLYRAVVSLGTLPADASVSIQTGFAATYGTVRKFECYGYSSQLNATINIESQYQQPTLHIRSSAYIDSIKVTAVGDWSGWDGYAILEYTKASD